MRPTFQARLVNGAQGDPVVYVDFLFERRALLFDLGDLVPLATRNILRVSHAFISHTHMDHFMGFDRVLRVCLGRERRLNLYGPPGLTTQVEHKLGAYTWNLVEHYPTDFTVVVHEWCAAGAVASAEFHCRERFRRRDLAPPVIHDGTLVEETAFRIRAVELDHHIPSLGFALEERRHVNVWKNRLQELGLPTGPWLGQLKQAVLNGAPEDQAVRIEWRDGQGVHRRELSLGTLRAEVLRIVPGQKIAFVVDAAYSSANAQRIVDLARDADLLFIETVFLEADLARARATRHLTARQAGMLARQARVRRMVPMHYSARYGDAQGELGQEAEAAFRDRAAANQKGTQG